MLSYVFGFFGLISLLLVILMYYFDYLPSKKVVQRTFPGSFFIYKEFRSAVKKIGSNYILVIEDVNATGLQAADLVFGGVYFDNPNLLPSGRQIRYSIGIHCSEQQGMVLLRTLSEYGFQSIFLPPTQTLFTFYKYRNMLSFFIVGLFWKKLTAELPKSKVDPRIKSAGIEICDMRYSKQILLDLVIGPNWQKYQFSTLKE